VGRPDYIKKVEIEPGGMHALLDIETLDGGICRTRVMTSEGADKIFGALHGKPESTSVKKGKV
jgi:hypothetical protein